MIDQPSTKDDCSGPVVDPDSKSARSNAKMSSTMNLKNQLKFFMDHYELSATQVAKKSGVSKQVLSLWLSGGSPRKIDQVKKVADIFKTSLDNLLYGEGLSEKESGINTIDAILGDDWVGGLFEIRIRKVKR